MTSPISEPDDEPDPGRRARGTSSGRWPAAAPMIGNTRHERDAEAALEVRPRAPQHDHADVGDHEREQRADVDQLGDLRQRHERGERARSAARTPAVMRTGVRRFGLRFANHAREQPVAAHREHDPRLAVEDRQHDAGDRDQRAERDQGRAPSRSQRPRSTSASGASWPSSSLYGGTAPTRGERDEDVEHRADRERADDRDRQVAARVLRSPRPTSRSRRSRCRRRRSRDAAVTTPSKPSGANGVRLSELNAVKASTMNSDDDRELDARP